MSTRRGNTRQLGGGIVWLVWCRDNATGVEITHVFSSFTKAEDYRLSDPSRYHVISDCVIDCPERKEMRTT